MRSQAFWMGIQSEFLVHFLLLLVRRTLDSNKKLADISIEEKGKRNQNSFCDEIRA
jgi:hypothetical protein